MLMSILFSQGIAVLRLVEQRKLQLSDSVPQHIDPLLKQFSERDPTLGYSSMEDLWGPEVYDVTVKDLLKLT